MCVCMRTHEFVLCVCVCVYVCARVRVYMHVCDTPDDIHSQLKISIAQHASNQNTIHLQLLFGYVWFS